jgi:hypothetical protein
VIELVESRWNTRENVITFCDGVACPRQETDSTNRNPTRATGGTNAKRGETTTAVAVRVRSETIQPLARQQALLFSQAQLPEHKRKSPPSKLERPLLRTILVIQSHGDHSPIWHLTSAKTPEIVMLSQGDQ